MASSPNMASERPVKRQRLSQKQIRFIREYVVHGNGVEAARKAGYSKKGDPHVLHQQGYENLRKPAVKAEIERIAAQIAPEITPMRVQRRLHEISHASQEAGQFGPAVRSEELLGKSCGMWIEQSIALTGTMNDTHIAALLDIARQRQAEPIDLVDDSKRDTDRE
jgi:Terminase small subunit